MTKLQLALITLDAFLTRKRWKEAEQTAINQKGDVESILQRTYYLSDGGYSRICMSLPEDDGQCNIWLDSVSTQKVKDMWINCKELIQDVRDAAQKEWLEA